jgi:hypothetical protein
MNSTLAITFLLLWFSAFVIGEMTVSLVALALSFFYVGQIIDDNFRRSLRRAAVTLDE